MAPWYLAPISQSHGESGEQGVDFAVPFHTPITSILDGIVKSIDCSVGYRCEVDIATTYQGSPATETFLHIDQPSVQVGQRISAGQLVGLSGGQLYGGLNPDSPVFSSGPHVEFDLFRSTLPFQNPIDPTQLARGGPSGMGTSFFDQLVHSLETVAGLPEATAVAVAQGVGTGTLPTPPSGGDIAGAISGLPGQVGHGLANALGASLQDIGIFLQRQAIALAVAVAVALVIFVR